MHLFLAKLQTKQSNNKINITFPVNEMRLQFPNIEDCLEVSCSNVIKTCIMQYLMQPIQGTKLKAKISSVFILI